ncbi:hypothetical protein HX096_17000 [Empedobacter falsenii]|uniref:hypothetical protein n=1 Tax=Empedobacter falsenii TaxID=343874 RepID=UPI002577E505|nr:hypothetical protein [Empedobacter falsenii]MDM1549550.1 hypothetical protein [Empedobacter falsenii]
MKLINFLSISLIVYISCNLFQNKNIEYKQLELDKNIYINYNYYKQYKDSVLLTIPIKFEIKNIQHFNFIYYSMQVNNYKLISNEYIVYNEDYKTIYPMPLKPYDQKIDSSINYLILQSINISNNKAKQISKKHNKDFDKWGERFRDTIQVTNYQQLKKDFPEIFDGLNEVGDSLIITTAEKGQKGFKREKFPVKW